MNFFNYVFFTIVKFFKLIFRFLNALLLTLNFNFLPNPLTRSNGLDEYFMSDNEIKNTIVVTHTTRPNNPEKEPLCNKKKKTQGKCLFLHNFGTYCGGAG